MSIDPCLATKNPFSKKKLIFPHYTQIIDADFQNKTPESNHKRFLNTVDGKSCAVVAGSSNLVGSNYGAFIDKHEVVFRMNQSPVNDKYAKDIGTKTTVWLLNVNHLNPGNTLINIDPNEENKFIIVHRANTKNKTFLPYQNYLIELNHKVIETFQAQTGIPNFSGGLKTLAIAMSLCETVDVFGFGKDKNGFNGYYFRARPFNDEKHTPARQQLFIEELAKQKQINLYMGNATK